MLYDLISAQLYGFDRELVKRVMMLRLWGGSYDPWVDHLVLEAASLILVGALNDYHPEESLV